MGINDLAMLDMGVTTWGTSAYGFVSMLDLSINIGNVYITAITILIGNIVVFLARWAKQVYRFLYYEALHIRNYKS